MTKDKALLWTDGRYFLQVFPTSEGFSKFFISTSLTCSKPVLSRYPLNGRRLSQLNSQSLPGTDQAAFLSMLQHEAA